MIRAAASSSLISPVSRPMASAFSPDGQWVTYTSHPDGALWRSRVDGNERLQLTLATMRAALPRWSPDGKQIAFSGSLPGAPWNIYIIPSSGGTPEHLLPGNQSQMDVNWSPNRGLAGLLRLRPRTHLALPSSILRRGESPRCLLPEGFTLPTGRQTAGIFRAPNGTPAS